MSYYLIWTTRILNTFNLTFETCEYHLNLMKCTKNLYNILETEQVLENVFYFNSFTLFEFKNSNNYGIKSVALNSLTNSKHWKYFVIGIL